MFPVCRQCKNYFVPCSNLFKDFFHEKISDHGVHKICYVQSCFRFVMFYLCINYISVLFLCSSRVQLIMRRSQSRYVVMTVQMILRLWLRRKMCHSGILEKKFVIMMFVLSLTHIKIEEKKGRNLVIPKHSYK